ncbi:choice-of-anchor Q domain-containing protein [Pontiellaceae bacterium B1224]|nr:choice-of-anchor Q domain-containing protein [Pontiellaceae bacterium B1224]
MMIRKLIGTTTFIASMLLQANTRAADFYVDLNSPNPTAPYSTWATAATNIQTAVDATADGDTVWVTNGTYILTAEITVTNDITLQSVNGPEVTIVDGGGSNRCFQLKSGSCLLEGFTIQNGYNGNGYSYNSDDDLGGGVLCQDNISSISNCTFRNNQAYAGGGLVRGKAEHCRFIGNSARGGGGGGGGGMLGGKANYCSFIENESGGSGGGMLEGSASYCTFQGNEARDAGGGMYGGTAAHCTFETNGVVDGYFGESALYGGGGMSAGTATNCVFTGNTADQTYGGGASCSTVINCVFTGNTAKNGGGIGSFVSHYGPDGPSKAVNCTFSGNSAGENGGGIYWTEIINGIVWDNTADGDGDNIWRPHKYDYDYAVHSSEVRHTCSPDTVHGVDGNITNAPMLISSSHLAPDSPCIGAGTNLFYGSDIDDEPWNNPPSMGCDEPEASADRPILLYITGLSERVLAEYEMDFSLTILGPCSGFSIDFGDCSTHTNSEASNYTVRSHRWDQLGPHEVVLTGHYSDSSDSVSITQHVEVVNAEDAAIYVAPNGNDSNSGMNWSTAKATIQSGVDAQMVSGGTVWVTNGTYHLTEEIRVWKPINVQSAHSAEFTIVDGGQSNRCFHLADSMCVLRDLTIANGFVKNAEGGGIYCDNPTPVVESCLIQSNVSSRGGGMYQGTANDCIFKNNRASDGGGMYEGTATDCLFEGNASTLIWIGGGGGMASSTASNCVFIGNSAVNDGGGACESTAVNCVFIRNSAEVGGGMASGYYTASAIHCTFLENNATSSGGGLFATSATNCIVWNNTATKSGGNLQVFDNVAFSCSPDLSHGEYGNITNAPLFADAAAGDYRLQSISPCINWGDDEYVTGSTDLDGNPRIVGTHVDMGAYEFQTDLGDDADGDGMPDEWERTYFGYNALPSENNDNDAAPNGDEYIAGTNPTNAASFFAVTNAVPSAEGFVVQWDAVEGRSYSVWWSDALTNDFQRLETDLPYPINSFTDTVHNTEDASFYQLEVELED